MEKGQFYHYETYGREASEAKKKKGSSLYSVLGEAFRDPEYSSHVKKKDTEEHPPEIVFTDMTFDEGLENEKKLKAQRMKLTELAETYAKAKKLRMKDGCVLAGVVSYPPGTTREMLVDLRDQLVIPFLKKKWGDNLRCVIGHSDEYFWDNEEKRRETHYQDHFYVIPDAQGTIRITGLHVGNVAKRKAITGIAGNDGKKHSDKAYRDAMRLEQDEFFKEVGKPAGWERITVKGIRYSRDQVKTWKQNQREMEVKKEGVEEAIEQSKLEAETEKQRTINESKAEAKRLITETENKVQIYAERILKNAKAQEEAVKEREGKVKLKEKILKKSDDFLKGVARAIEDKKKELSGEEKIDVPIIVILNAEDVLGDERVRFYKEFFRRLPAFVKDIIKTIREVPKHLHQKEISTQTNEEGRLGKGLGNN